MARQPVNVNDNDLHAPTSRRPADDDSTVGLPTNALGLVYSETQQAMIDPYREWSDAQ